MSFAFTPGCPRQCSLSCGVFPSGIPTRTTPECTETKDDNERMDGGLRDNGGDVDSRSGEHAVPLHALMMTGGGGSVR